MDRRVFHGKLNPADIAQAILGEFNQGNLCAQTMGQGAKMIVQIGTSSGAVSGGQTALTVTLQKVEDGVMIEMGQQAWMGVAASLGASALAAFKNPLSLLGRLDDIAQDIENLQLADHIWQVIEQAARSAGASHQLSDNLSRLTCIYCGAANPQGEPSCIACGAPMVSAQPTTCPNCGFVVKADDKKCPNCNKSL
ncbi:MAG: zinc ribbon domain-containing protein [Anaerolineales bacterium]|nr:zinc ribbon domain-containing protein [Anaerolineales bacterium]